MDCDIVRPVKRRISSHACSLCRTRKVRCHKPASDEACTNCRLDAVNCVPAETRRRRNSALSRPLSPPLHNATTREKESARSHVSRRATFDHSDRLPSLPEASNNGSTKMSVLLSGLQDEEQRKSPTTLYESPFRAGCSDLGRHLPLLAQSPLAQSESALAVDLLPSFIQSIPPRFDSDDIEYLHRKGVLDFPNQRLQNELLRCYIQFVHPSLPLLDLPEFMDAIEKKSENHKVSLLVMRAVMFAATPYIDMQHVKDLGYKDRPSLRKAFFERTKLLHDLDYELDRISVVQSVLLMTYWYDDPDDSKAVWYYLAHAVSFTRMIGVNYRQRDTPPPSQKERRLWKRLYWSCYMRHTLIAVALRQPMRWGTGDLDVPMLDFTDFDIETFPYESTFLLGAFPSTRSMPVLRELANMCIGMAKLCVCISRILNTQYSTVGSTWGPSQAVGSLWGAGPEVWSLESPRTDTSTPFTVLQSEHELQAWHQEYVAELSSSPESADHARNRVNCQQIEILRGLLTGLYLTAIGALYRPQVLHTSSNNVIPLQRRKNYRQKICQAADDITTLYDNLYQHNLIRYLPNFGVTCLVPAITLHLLNVKDCDSNLYPVVQRKFQSCMKALEQLRDMYTSAAFAYRFLETAANRIAARSNATTYENFDTISTSACRLPSTPTAESRKTSHRAGFDANNNSDEHQIPHHSFAASAAVQPVHDEAAGDTLSMWTHPHSSSWEHPDYAGTTSSEAGNSFFFSTDMDTQMDFNSLLTPDASADFFDLVGGFGFDMEADLNASSAGMS